MAATRPRAASWPTLVREDLAGLRARGSPDDRIRALEKGGPRLVDTEHRDEILAALARVEPSAIASSARLSYLSGTAAVLRGAPTDAIADLVRAQATAEPSDRAFVARVAFELGCLYLDRGEHTAVETILLWARDIAGPDSADLHHLDAMVANNVGRYSDARPAFRAAIAAGSRALTPLTRVLALKNLAVSLNHVEPEESLSLCGLALAALEVERLHPRVRPAVRNVMGYALICLGRFDHARRTATAAREDARDLGYSRIELFASFNLSIVDELEGELDDADERLASVAARAAAEGMSDLEGWTAIRRAWLRTRVGDPAGARALIATRFPYRVPLVYSETVDMLDAVIRATDEPGRARSAFASLAAIYEERGNELDRFVCLLWQGLADQRSGAVDRGRRAVSEACRVGASHGFRLGSNFWSAELVEAARVLASEEHRAFVDGLLAVGAPRTAAPASPDPVVLRADGGLNVGGTPLPEEAWRQGRTGRRQLHRLFDALRAAYPSAVARDELADLLWPESDGDRARVNLYAAVNDLRHLLERVPGVGLRADEGRYGLQLAGNVVVEPSSGVAG